jgi:hypothetical protein
MKDTTLLALSILLLSACGGEDNAPIEPDQAPPKAEAPVPPFSEVSECYGFSEKKLSVFLPAVKATVVPLDYCAAERLYWRYDPVLKVVKLLNTRVMLNCCGDRSVSVQKTKSGYTVTEIDRPLGYLGSGSFAGARCLCECVFDFFAELKQVPPEMINLTLIRGETVYSGTLDLTKKQGTLVLDPTALPHCR